ncbi:ATPase [Roseobacter phage RDJL6]|nr:ATPase [Roseobacter phage RDJL6]
MTSLPSIDPNLRRFTEPTWGNAPIERLRVLARKSSVTLKVTPDMIGAAQALRRLMAQAQKDGAGSKSLAHLTAIRNRLGADMFLVLYDFLHAGIGLEQIEKDNRWSARSAKIVLAVALRNVLEFELLKAPGSDN